MNRPGQEGNKRIGHAAVAVRIPVKFALVACLALPSFQDDTAVGLSKGMTFPDFLLPNVEGGFGRLSDYRGRKTLVISFASW